MGLASAAASPNARDSACLTSSSSQFFTYTAGAVSTAAAQRQTVGEVACSATLALITLATRRACERGAQAHSARTATRHTEPAKASGRRPPPAAQPSRAASARRAKGAQSASKGAGHRRRAPQHAARQRRRKCDCGVQRRKARDCNKRHPPLPLFHFPHRHPPETASFNYTGGHNFGFVRCTI
jgi:hypothetical protein